MQFTKAAVDGLTLRDYQARFEHSAVAHPLCSCPFPLFFFLSFVSLFSSFSFFPFRGIYDFLGVLGTGYRLPA